MLDAAERRVVFSGSASRSLLTLLGRVDSGTVVARTGRVENTAFSASRRPPLANGLDQVGRRETRQKRNLPDPAP